MNFFELFLINMLLSYLINLLLKLPANLIYIEIFSNVNHAIRVFTFCQQTIINNLTLISYFYYFI